MKRSTPSVTSELCHVIFLFRSCWLLGCGPGSLELAGRKGGLAWFVQDDGMGWIFKVQKPKLVPVVANVTVLVGLFVMFPERGVHFGCVLWLALSSFQIPNSTTPPAPPRPLLSLSPLPNQNLLVLA